MGDVLESGSVSRFGNRYVRLAQNFSGLVKAHGKKILVRCTAGQRPELTIELCTAHCYFTAEALDIILLVTEVGCHSSPYFYQEGISLFNVDFRVTVHFLMNTLLIRVIGHLFICPCKPWKLHNTANLSQKGTPEQDTKNSADRRQKTEDRRPKTADEEPGRPVSSQDDEVP
jgi:hypothetical protein